MQTSGCAPLLKECNSDQVRIVIVGQTRDYSCPCSKYSSMCTEGMLISC